LQVKKQINGANESAEKRVAITLKLLEAPYLRMKTYGAINRRTNQSILEEALNDWLGKVGA
jgi:translation initiation factor 2 alpha subunit (eIF-2alpha)